VVEHLSGMHKTMGLIPSTIKNKRKRKKKKIGAILNLFGFIPSEYDHNLYQYISK
jgi:hypothetical protein